MRSRIRPLLSALLLFCRLLAPPLSAEPAGTADEAFFSFSLADSSADLFMTGAWKTSLLSAADLSFTDAGFDFSAPNPLILNQTIDLSLEALLDERWFVTAEADDSSYLKSFALGYRGASGERLRQAVVGNRYPGFPSYPFLDLAAGTAAGSSVLGAYLAFGNGDDSISQANPVDSRWAAQVLVQIDSARQREKTYRGSRELLDAVIDLSDRYRGHAFVLPEERLDSIPAVFYEDSTGDLRDAGGRRFRQLQPEEYAVSRNSGYLELAFQPSALVAVAYRKGLDAPWADSMGDYRAADGSAGDGFLGAVQACFDLGGSIELSEYPQCGGGSGRPATMSIDGTPALAIFQPGAFSPFEQAELYELPTGFTAEDGSLSDANGRANDSLRLETYDSLFSAGEPRLVALRSRAATNPRSPEYRFPLAALAPWAYLTGFRTTADGTRLSFQGSGVEGVYDIGTAVAAASVRVYRDGLPDNEFTFNPASGIVSLRRAASSLEVIRINYTETGGAQFGEAGNLTVAAGAALNDGPIAVRGGATYQRGLQADPGLASDNPSFGAIAIGAAFGYEAAGFRAETSIGFRAGDDREAVSRIAGMEDATISLGLSETAATPAEAPAAFGELTALGRADLVYRNYRQFNLLGAAELSSVDDSEGRIETGRSGPYAVAGPSGLSLAAEFKLDELRPWTGFQVRLDSGADVFQQAEELVFSLRCMDLNSDGVFRVIVQTGSLADVELGRSEADWLSVTKTVFVSTEAAAALISGDWIEYRISFNDDDRRRLADAGILRLLVIRDSGQVAGRIILSPPELRGAVYRPVVAQAGAVSAAVNAGLGGLTVALAERVDNRLRAIFPIEIDYLHTGPSVQRVLSAEWTKALTGQAIGADGRVAAPPLREYRSFSFFFRPPAATMAGYRNAVLRVTLGADTDVDAAWLNLAIPLTAFPAETWTKVRADYSASVPAIFLNETPISTGSLVYQPPGRDGLTANAVNLILIESNDSEIALGDGNFAVDEFYLEDPAADSSLAFGQTLRWQDEGQIFGYESTPILSDLLVLANLDGGIAFDGSQGLIRSQAALGATLGMARIDLDAALSYDDAASDPMGWKASHSIEMPLERLLLKEKFAYDPSKRSVDHTATLDLNTPFAFTIKASQTRRPASHFRTWTAGLSADRPLADSSSRLSFDTAAVLTYSDSPANDDDWSALYPAVWLESWKSLMPDDGINVRRRQVSAKAHLGYRSDAWGLTLRTETVGLAVHEKLRDANFQLSIEIPLTLGNIDLGIQARREVSTRQALTASAAIAEATDDVGLGDDIAAYTAVANAASGLLTSLPAFNLLDQRQPDLIKALAAERTAAGLVDRMEFNFWNDPPSDWSALVRPALLRLAVMRRLDQRLDIFTDRVDIQAQALFSAVNLFGAYGSSPLTAWYTSDEFYQRYETSFYFIPDAEPDAVFACEHGAVFHDSASELKASNNFRWTNAVWSENLVLSLAAPALKSFSAILFGAVLDRLAETEHSPYLAGLTSAPFLTERRGGIDLNLSKAEAFVWDCRFSIKTTVRAAGRAAFATFAELGFSGSPDRPLAVGMEIGTTLTLTF